MRFSSGTATTSFAKSPSASPRPPSAPRCEVPTLGAPVPVNIPPGTQNGSVFRLKGRGVKNVQGYGQGDLLARVQVEIPTRLNSEQKAKLEEFARLCDESVHPLSKSFFDRAKRLFR